MCDTERLINARSLGGQVHDPSPVVKCTWYGRPSDPWIVVRERYELGGAVHREIVTKAPIQQVTLDLTIGEPVKVTEAR